MAGFREIKAYEKSYKSVIEIYEITKTFPREELYAMANQLRRSAMSIPLNIAEGYAKRESQAEFKRFLMMARGSCAETSVLLDFSRDLKYISEEMHGELSERYEVIAKMLHAYSDKLK